MWFAYIHHPPLSNSFTRLSLNGLSKWIHKYFLVNKAVTAEFSFFPQASLQKGRRHVFHRTSCCHETEAAFFPSCNPVTGSAGITGPELTALSQTTAWIWFAVLWSHPFVWQRPAESVGSKESSLRTPVPAGSHHHHSG